MLTRILLVKAVRDASGTGLREAIQVVDAFCDLLVERGTEEVYQVAYKRHLEKQIRRLEETISLSESRLQEIQEEYNSKYRHSF